MKKSNLENITLAAIAAVSILIALGNKNTTVFLDEPLTPDIYGLVLSILTTVLCILKIILNIAREKKKPSTNKVTVGNCKVVFWQIILIILYVWTALNIGYFVSSVIYAFLAFSFLYGITEIKKNKKMLIQFMALAVVLMGALYYLFDLVKVFMPNTPLI